MRRLLGFAYGVACYLIFFVTFLYAIGFVGGGNLYGPDKKLVTPTAIDLAVSGRNESLVVRVLIDACLLALFAVQHSVMARSWFKRRWTQVVSPLLERSTYVLIASLTLLLLFWQWRPIGPARIVWDVQNQTGKLVLEALFWLGWLTVLVTTFLIDHFDLFGLRQSYCYFRGDEYKPPDFKMTALYKVVRHPIMLGFIIAFWATPRMTLSHFFFAGMTTAYILLAIQLEERDLMRSHGETYAKYRERVSMLLPIRMRGERTKPGAAGD